MSTNAIQELRDLIEIEVKAGFASKKEILESAIDALLGDYDYDWIEDSATSILDECLKAHYEKQKAWQIETDCDRLDEAFAELDRNGIVARQNFTCCQTCGHAEISYAIEDTEKFRPVRGYVFYHQQDLESAARNGYLYLAYGSLSGKEEDSAKIAQEISDTIKRHGLEPDWNGSVRTRICIREIDWKRRRDTEQDNE